MAIELLDLPDGTIASTTEGGLIHARGIPYARSNRFEHPIPISPWEGVRDCTSPATICPQLPSRLDHITGRICQGRCMSEDCTHLSIAAPLKTIGGNTKKLPVMVFFHGGVYLSGGGDLDCYQGAELARRNTIVVNVTYRLGVFGYLTVPDVAPANLGLLDQIEALKWVKQNIGCFGGDADNVTLFGESAGADSIFCLMISEGTAGLFHRAILQSAPLGRCYDKKSDEMAKLLGQIAKAMFAEKPVTQFTTTDMLFVQGKLLTAAKDLNSKSMAFCPSFGNFPLPPQSAIDDRQSERTKGIPLFIGYNKDEGTAFAELNETLSRYYDIPLLGSWIRYSVSWMISRQLFHWPSNRIRQQITKAGGKCSSYYFTWSPTASRWGATHTIELPFLLGSREYWENAPMLGGPQWQLFLEQMGREVKDLWVAFCRGAHFGPETVIIDGAFRMEKLLQRAL